MIEIKRSALVEFSDQQMFDLVNDIEHYPKFMKGCVSATVKSRSDIELIGELKLAKGGIKQQFTTRNLLYPPERIEMHLLDGPFKSFSAEWNFLALRSDACKLSLNMEFEFNLGLLDHAAEGLFRMSANNLVDSVVQRAHEVYGDA